VTAAKRRKMAEYQKQYRLSKKLEKESMLMQHDTNVSMASENNNETQRHLAVKPTQQNDSMHEQQRACTFTVAADTIDIEFRARFHVTKL
jgi:hypothetical protein